MKLTPAMKQYVEIKESYPDCVVMFRMGDFYEMFYEDAKISAQVLGITLTARGKGEAKAPLADIPYHSACGAAGGPKTCQRRRQERHRAYHNAWHHHRGFHTLARDQ